MVIMNVKRITKHLMTTRWKVNKYFPSATLYEIEQEIAASELRHAGEVRFVVEAMLDPASLLKNQSAQARAIDVFSQLRIWDTEYNNGLLIYLLLADHAVEIVADRGINAKVGAQEWEKICRAMEADFKQGKFKSGVITGIRSVTEHLAQHFPRAADDKNELSDAPVIL
jgi:uncharacterized membrane protein